MSFQLPDKTRFRLVYEKFLPIRALITKDLEAAIEDVLKSFSSRPTVKGRVKEFGSYYKKYIKVASSNLKLPIITDIIGIRIVCPFFEDRLSAEKLLRQFFQVVEVERKGSDYSFKEFGYESIHLLIKIPESILKTRGDCGLEVAEVQIRTILQDAWAEVEHELVYKAEFAPFGEPMKRKLAAVNASLSLADTIFQEIRNHQRQLNKQLDMRQGSVFQKVDESIDSIIFASEMTAVVSINPPDSSDTDVEIGYTMDDFLLHALSAHNKKQFKKAIDLYTQILDMTLDSAIGSLVYKHRGMANFAQSQYEEAILDFTKSLELDGQSHKSAYYRGVVKAVLQRYIDAIEDFSLSLEINPYYAFCFYRRGQAYYHIEDLPQALADCNSALALEPDIAEFHKFKDLLLKKLNL
ncbi:MAG: (p)ppGpp synthetase [Spirochaetaceae bacterium]|nr:(p)ppGpp synthetase [Spirochaetaceae bacterium]